MREYHDQLGRKLSIEKPITKIVSLVPSITELLYDLDLSRHIVGRTKFCVFDGVDKTTASIVGGTKQVHFDKIDELTPDLIICNKEENTLEIVETLARSYPVYVSAIQTIHGALSMIEDLGEILDRETISLALIKEINNKQVAFHKQQFPEVKCLYMIWNKPMMTIGMDTFIYHMLQEMNCTSVVRDFRYPEITEDGIRNSSAEYILLSDEPFPFGVKHKEEFAKLFPDKKIILVDGSYFSWYGSRILKAYDYMLNLRETIL